MKKLFLFVLSLYIVHCSTVSVTTKTEPTQTTKSVRFTVVGDIMAHSTQISTAYNPACKCYDFKPVFSDVKNSIQNADIAIGNLETTLPGKKELYAGYPLFGAPDSLAEAIKDTGFDILTTSNNHSVDKGKIGLKRTIEVLDSLKIGRVGTYHSPEDHSMNRILFFQKNGIRFALLSYTYGTNGIAVPKGFIVNLIDKEKIREDIQIAKNSGIDVLMLYYHFGTEYLRLPDKFQREMVDFALEEGVDIILGGHPHSLQPYYVQTYEEKNKNKNKRKVLYIYSLGNFVSAQHKRYIDGGIILNFTVTVQTKEMEGKKESLINFQNVNYDPVYVHVSHEKGRSQYHILPVKDYLKNDKVLKLSKHAMTKMMLFYKDTTDHFDKHCKVE